MSSAFNDCPTSPLPRRNRPMINRREFINSGLVASAAMVGSAALCADRRHSSESTGPAAPIYLATFDSRFEHCRQFAGAMAAHAIPSAGFHGDVTNIWYAELDPVWRSRPVAIAGMTTEGALFCLERLAWDHGMRVVYRGTHEPAVDGGFDHVLETSAKRAHLVVERLSGLGTWPREIASLIAGISDPLPAFPSKPTDLARAEYRSRPVRKRAEIGVPLFSWVIAPRPHSS
jgi:hypothetical protein